MIYYQMIILNYLMILFLILYLALLHNLIFAINTHLTIISMSIYHLYVYIILHGPISY